MDQQKVEMTLLETFLSLLFFLFCLILLKPLHFEKLIYPVIE